MEASLGDRVPPAALRDPDDRFWVDVKASDDLLAPIFKTFYERLSLPNLMRKSDYHRLVHFVEADSLPSEVSAVLDSLNELATRARPGDLPE